MVWQIRYWFIPGRICDMPNHLHVLIDFSASCCCTKAWSRHGREKIAIQGIEDKKHWSWKIKINISNARTIRWGSDAFNDFRGNQDFVNRNFPVMYEPKMVRLN